VKKIEESKLNSPYIKNDIVFFLKYVDSKILIFYLPKISFLKYQLLYIMKRSRPVEFTKEWKDERRKKMINKFKDGIMSPPKCAHEILPVSGNILLKCPSNTTTDIYDINIIISDKGKFKFICTCSNSCENCIHIIGSIIKIINDHITSSTEYVEVKDKYDDIVKMLNLFKL
jgi:hypothetical protein